MSKYVKYSTDQLKNQELLLAALAEMGWSGGMVEVHETPQTLIGYHGDARPEKAHVIIRRQHIDASANDIGFVRQDDGTYKPIVSENETNLQGHGIGRRGGKTFVSLVTEKYSRVAGDAAISTLLTKTVPKLKMSGAIPMHATAKTVTQGQTRKVVVTY